MKRPLQEAAELFRQLEMGGNHHPPEFYRAMAQLAEGLHRIEKRLDEFQETASQPRPDPSPSRQRRFVARRVGVKAFSA